MRTGLILGSRRTRQQVGLQKFALRLKARFNPFRDSAACTIVMRWQRRLKSYLYEDQTLFHVTRPRYIPRSLRTFFAGQRIILHSQTEELRQPGRNPFKVGHHDLTNDSVDHHVEIQAVKPKKRQNKPIRAGFGPPFLLVQHRRRPRRVAKCPLQMHI